MRLIKTHFKKLVAICLVSCVLLLIASINDKVVPESSVSPDILLPQEIKERPFLLGFTPWPADFSQQGIDQSYAFITDHGDIVAHHFDTGIPWQESLDGKPFSSNLMENWKYRKTHTPSSHKIYLALTPINTQRNGLANYWGDAENMPLPTPWSEYRFNDEAVQKAYLNYTIRAIEYFEPDYVSVGIESNLLITTVPEVWNDYLELNAYVYSAIKLKYPDLPVFSTVQYEHFRGIQEESKQNAHLQASGVVDLMKHSDLFCMSTYHFGPAHNPMSAAYFDAAVAFKKPLCIAEMGILSKNITINGARVKGDEDDQYTFLSFILSESVRNNMAFVINFVNIDYDKLLDRLPEADREAAKAWVHTGLVNADGTPKKSLTIWDEYLAQVWKSR